MDYHVGALISDQSRTSASGGCGALLEPNRVKELQSRSLSPLIWVLIPLLWSLVFFFFLKKFSWSTARVVYIVNKQTLNKKKTYSLIPWYTACHHCRLLKQDPLHELKDLDRKKKHMEGEK